MPIVNMNDLLNHAYCNDYAVGTFNLVNLDFLKGVLEAAERTRSPVILNLSEANLKRADFELLMPAVEAAAIKALVPVAIEYNNCTHLDSAIQAINHGCNGVMIDASDSSLENNLTISSGVVKMAHGCGVAVEGKLSFLPAVALKNTDNYLMENTYNELEDILDYVKNTEVDLLNVAIMTMHGIHDSALGKPNLDFQQLKLINETLNIPLAVQGEKEFSSEQYHQLISNGVAKIHFSINLSDIMLKQNKENTETNISGDYNGFTEAATSIITEETERYLHLLKSINRASNVLALCHLWAPVEHLIIYNIEKLNKDEINAMIAEGYRVLSAIPGVREVFTGEAVQESASYRYTWLVRFCHPLVIDSYRIHPAHIAFADNLFRPVAGERISIDYQTIKYNG